MKKKNHIIRGAALLPALAALTSAACAVEESEVQSAVASAGRDAVSGNVFIWFLCAVAFLKVSQKIDSFLASLGVNAGRTGGSMLGELMIAGRTLAGAAGRAAGGVFARGRGTASAAAEQAPADGNTGHGAIGMTRRAAGTAAASAAAGRGSGLRGALGGMMFRSSLARGGPISADAVHRVATGSVSRDGTITGPLAEEALAGYMVSAPEETPAGAAGPAGEGVPAGLSAETAPADGEAADGEDIVTLRGGKAARGAVPGAPSFSKVEIGGGRITGYETPAGGGEARRFAMYSASQYTEPDGEYETVKTADGGSWYRQYAQPAVEEIPKDAGGRNIVFEKKIVMRMPRAPQRKDRA